MNERPPETALGRLLAGEAERAIPSDLDLWPSIARRLRSGAPSASRPHRRAGDVPGASGWRSEVRPEGRSAWWARGRIRGLELPGLAASVGLVALVVGLLLITVGRPGSGSFATRPGDNASPAAPEGCSIDLDIAPREGATGTVLISVVARVAHGCAAADELELAVLNATGKRSAISGNPVTLPLADDGQERRVDTAVTWANWCGERGRFQLETTLGDEVRRLSMPTLPQCFDADAPSTVRPIADGAVSIASQPAYDPAAP